MRLRRRNMKIQSLFTPQMNTHEHDDRTRKGRRKKKRSQVRGLLHLLGRLEEPVLLPLLQPSRRRHGAQPPPQQQPQIKSRTSHQPPSRLATPTPRLVGLPPKTGLNLARGETGGGGGISPDERATDRGGGCARQERNKGRRFLGVSAAAASSAAVGSPRLAPRCFAEGKRGDVRVGREKRREERREVNYSLTFFSFFLPSRCRWCLSLSLSPSDSGAFFGIPVSLPAAAFLFFFLIFLTYSVQFVVFLT